MEKHRGDKGGERSVKMWEKFSWNVRRVKLKSPLCTVKAYGVASNNSTLFSFKGLVMSVVVYVHISWGPCGASDFNVFILHGENDHLCFNKYGGCLFIRIKLRYLREEKSVEDEFSVFWFSVMKLCDCSRKQATSLKAQSEKLVLDVSYPEIYSFCRIE